MTTVPDVAQALFNPASIALIGASGDANKHASLPQQYLRRHGYSGAIFPVNPARDSVLGEQAYKSVGAIGRPVDHAFIMLPTDGVFDAVADCCAAGVRCATILSNGFAESGSAGRERQATLIDLARRGGVRVLGPNSLGVINLVDHVALSANEILSLPELRPGRYGLVSQSGSLIGALLSRGQARGLGFSKLVSVGNEADIGTAEVGEMLIDDPSTDAILLFLETVRDAPALAAMARRAFAAGKPVVAFRVGRSEIGEQLAASHTGALASHGPALDAFLRECGIVRVETLDALLEVPPLLRGQRPSKGRRVTVVSTTGGGGALVIDGLSRSGAVFVPPGQDSIARLAGAGIDVRPEPLIDLTLAGTNARTYGAVLKELVASEDCDAVVAVVGSSSQFRPDRAVTPITATVAAGTRKPVAVFLTPQADQSLSLLADAGVAAFRTPESCGDGVRAYFEWRAPREEPPARDISAAKAKLAAIAGREPDPAEAAALFGALGLPIVADVTLPSDEVELARADLSAIAFPVVAKVLSADIAHKTEVGGVVVGIDGPEALRAACARIGASVRAARPHAAIAGIQVQPMVRGLAEALLGYRRDPTVGPLVTLGAGGVLAELHRDISIRLAPVGIEDAREMIAEVRGLAPIRGYRNLPEGDVEALAEAVVAFSNLAALGEVAEAEINPLLVRESGRGVVAVDALVKLGEPS